MNIGNGTGASRRTLPKVFATMSPPMTLCGREREGDQAGGKHVVGQWCSVECMLRWMRSSRCSAPSIGQS